MIVSLFLVCTRALNDKVSISSHIFAGGDKELALLVRSLTLIGGFSMLEHSLKVSDGVKCLCLCECEYLWV